MTDTKGITKVVTGEVRASFLNWKEPRKNELSGKDEYSVELLISKTDLDTVKALKSAMKVALTAKFGDKMPPKMRNPLKDGDTETKSNGDPLPEHYAGHWMLRVKSTDKIGVINIDGDKLTDANDFVSGDYCKAAINAFAYDQAGNRGVSFGLQNLLFTRRGVAFSAKTSANDDFGISTKAAQDFGIGKPVSDDFMEDEEIPFN